MTGFPGNLDYWLEISDIYSTKGISTYDTTVHKNDDYYYIVDLGAEKAIIQCIYNWIYKYTGKNNET